MPHSVLKRTLNELQTAALVAASTSGTEIVAVNARLRQEVDATFLEGANHRKVLAHLGIYDDSPFRRVLAGDSIATRRREFKGRDGWGVSSRLPEIQGWPPSALCTYHWSMHQHDAVEQHRRDRSAVQAAILLDQIRMAARATANMVSAMLAQVDEACESFIDRVAEEPALVQALA